MQLNKPEEVMLTIVTAAIVSCLRRGGQVFRPVCLSVSYQNMSNTYEREREVLM